MANVKRGQVTATDERKRHLRDQKREFWKAERRSARYVARKAAEEVGGQVEAYGP
jgi:hypothetical protein